VEFIAGKNPRLSRNRNPGVDETNPKWLLPSGGGLMGPLGWVGVLKIPEWGVKAVV